MTLDDREPKVIITVTASDYFGTVEARREVRAMDPSFGGREQVAKAAAEAASHVSDLMETHIAAIDRARQV